MALELDITQHIINVQWGGICRFAVCGYDGNFKPPPSGPPVFFGVGAYSVNGKSWTKFTVFQNGSAVSVFNMRDPRNEKQNVIIVGGCTNQSGEGFAQSTAKLTTIAGSGPSASGGTSQGRNVANFGSIGYDKDKQKIYAVENSGTDAATHILHSFPIGTAEESDSASSSEEPTILWAGPHYPKIGTVKDCSTTGAISGMKVKDKDGKEHTLSVTDNMLKLDGSNITPGGARVESAAGGLNGQGQMIIIAVGYHSVDDEDVAIAWWSIEGRGWVKIPDIWSGNPILQTASMATAVTI